MNIRRLLLLATVSTAALGHQDARAELNPADIGGWGGAWGEEIVPEAPPARRAPAAVPTVPAAAPAVRSAPLPPGPSPADIGGWGDAWGEETAPAPVPARRSPPVRPVATAASPVAAVPVQPSPSAADIGTWGDAWGGATSPAAAPARVAQSTPTQPAGSPPAAPPAGAIDPENPPVHLVADQIIHDRELGIVTATGNVEIVQTGKTLTADTVSYNLKQDVISASGNVTLVEPEGNVAFSEYFELTGDFKEGVAQEIRVLLADRSRMRAASARRVAGVRTDYEDPAYTACEPCAEDPGREPLWQVKAKEATHDQDAKVIEYRDVWMELGGVPIAYTPYLSHPDPTVKRKSGFLVPTAGVSSSLGTNVTVPYFWAINDNQDLTFSPRFLFPKSEVTRTPQAERFDREILRRVVLAGEHRWVGTQGETRTAASLTAHKRTGELRGHVKAKGRFDLTEVWRTGYQVEHQSDDNYSSVYGYPIESERPWLTTRPYIEGFGRNNYMMAEGFAFQSTRTTDTARSPLVLPHAVYSFVGTPNRHGGFWSVDADTLAYSRSQGTDAGRLSTRVAWNQGFTTSGGQLYTMVASLRGDGYHANEVEDGGEASSGRVVPQVSMNWRYPFANTSGNWSQVVEPLAMVAASPNGGNPRGIPNEDSIDFELDDTNVLRPNRPPGLDRVEGGLRGAYGLRWSAYRGTGFVVAQAAQGWRAHDDSTFGPTSGFDEKLSDYVGRLDISPTGNFNLLNRVRLDKDSLEVRRNENSLVIGPRALRASATYMMFERPATDLDFKRRQYLVYSLASDFSRYWSASASASHDLTDEGGLLGWNGRLIYSDECFAFVTNVRRYITTNSELGSGYELTFNLVFKTLGEVPIDVF